ncbi:Flavodoxin [uncultured archaeon]|nr:Flavodoxin [uncultured archaeon]
MKALVAYYSRTGTTKKVAEAVAKELSADLDEIIDEKNRGGPLGYITGGRDAFLKKQTTIRTQKNPADYDLVVVATPVWADLPTPAARTYIEQNKGKIRKNAFLITQGGNNQEKPLKELELIAEMKPAAFLALRTKEVADGEYSAKVKEFAGKLNI